MEVHESIEIQPEELAPWLATAPGAAAHIFDLRTAEEFARALLPRAALIDATELLDIIAERVPQRDTPILCYCARGITSLKVATALRGRGFVAARSLAGGFMAWEALLAPAIPSATADSLANAANPQRDRSPGEHAALSPDERARYARQLMLPGFGKRAQLRLQQARVAIVGVGGLGSPIALYLAAAGVGYLTLIDPDTVERSNLQRQILFADADCGHAKVACAARRLLAQNPLVTITPHAVALTPDNAHTLLRAQDIVIDGTDDFAARYAMNRTCVDLRIPLIHGSVAQFTGQVSVFSPAHGGPCYACLYPKTPQTPGVAGGVASGQTCADTGVLGVVPGLVGMLQANAALKCLAELGEPAFSALLQVDLLHGTMRTLHIPRDPACVVCRHIATR